MVYFFPTCKVNNFDKKCRIRKAKNVLRLDKRETRKTKAVKYPYQTLQFDFSKKMFIFAVTKL